MSIQAHLNKANTMIINNHIRMFIAKVARSKIPILEIPMMSESRIMIGSSVHINSEIPPREAMTLKAEIGMESGHLTVTITPDLLWSIFCPDLVPTSILSCKIVETPAKLSKLQPVPFRLVFNIEEICFIDHNTNMPRCFRMGEVDLNILNNQTALLNIGGSERPLTPQGPLSSAQAPPLRRFPVPPPSFAPIQGSPLGSWPSSLNFHPSSSPNNLRTSSFRPSSSFEQSLRSSHHRTPAGNGGAASTNAIEDLLNRNNQRAMERRRRNQLRGNGESPVYETIAPRRSSDDMDLDPPVNRDSQIILQAQRSSNAVERRAEKAAQLIRQVESFLEENQNYTIESPRLMEMLRQLREGSRDQAQVSQQGDQNVEGDSPQDEAGDRVERTLEDGPAQNTRSHAYARMNENEN